MVKNAATAFNDRKMDTTGQGVNEEHCEQFEQRIQQRKSQEKKHQGQTEVQQHTTQQRYQQTSEENQDKQKHRQQPQLQQQQQHDQQSCEQQDQHLYEKQQQQQQQQQQKQQRKIQKKQRKRQQKQRQKQQLRQQRQQHEQQSQSDSGNEDDLSMLYFMSEPSLSEEAETSMFVDEQSQLLGEADGGANECNEDDALPSNFPLPQPAPSPANLVATEERDSAAAPSSSTGTNCIPSPPTLTNQNRQAHGTTQNSCSPGDTTLSSWDSLYHPRLQQAVVFQFSSEEASALRARPPNNGYSGATPVRHPLHHPLHHPIYHPLKHPVQHTVNPSNDEVVHDSVTSVSQPHAKQQVYPPTQAQPKPQQHPRSKHKRRSYNEENVFLPSPYTLAQMEGPQNNSENHESERKVESNSSSSVSTQGKELADQFIQQLRVSSRGALQETEGELNTSLEESYAGPDTNELHAIIRHGKSGNPTIAPSFPEFSTRDETDALPLRHRLSSMDTHLIENTSPEVRVTNAANLGETPNTMDGTVHTMDDTVNMTLSESEDSEQHGHKNNTKRIETVERDGENDNEDTNDAYRERHSNHSNTDDSLRPLDWEQQNSADDEKTADEDKAEERSLRMRKSAANGGKAVPGHRRKQSGDTVAVMLSMGAGTNWRGMERDQIPFPEQDDDEEAGITFPTSERAQFSVGSTILGTGRSRSVRVSRRARREQKDRQKQKPKQKPKHKRTNHPSYGDDAESPAGGLTTVSNLHGTTMNAAEQLSPNIESCSQSYDEASHFPNWLPKHDVQFLQNATKQVELSPGVNVNDENYSPKGIPNDEVDFKIEDAFSSESEEGFVQNHRIHLQTKDMTLDQVESQMRRQCVHDGAVLRQREGTSEKFDRSVFLPTTTVVDMKEVATYICPRCKTRQREFFTTKNAPRQFESASGYLALYFAIYVIASLYIFGLEEGWPALDCIYFAVITLTTAGLGDFVPTSDGNKIICSIFIYFGVACIGLLLGSYIAGMLDEISSREARENRLNSCPNCARIKNMKDAAERRQMSVQAFDHVSQTDGSFAPQMRRPTRNFLSERTGSDLSKSSIHEPDLRQSFKRQKSEHHPKHERSRSSMLGIPEVPPRKAQNCEFTPPMSTFKKSFLDGSANTTPVRFVDSSPAMNSHRSSLERSPAAGSRETIDGLAPLNVIDSYGTGTGVHGGGSFSPVGGPPAPPLPALRQPDFLGSPLTRRILGRQSHTRHFSFDINNNSTRAFKSFHDSIRKMSADIQQTPTIRETEDGQNSETEFSENWKPYDEMSVEEESVSSDSSFSRTSLETERKMNQVRTAKYVFVTLKQALMNSLVIIFVGCMGFWFIEGFSLIDSWYFTTVLLTTVGYGDIVPVTKGGKLFATVYILVAGTILLNNMSMISMIPLELRKRRIERAVLTQFGDQLDDDALRELATGPLIQRLRMAVNRPDGLNECTREMFAIAMLVRLGKVTEDDVLQTFAAFRRLDVNSDGVLNSKSIIAGMIHKRRSMMQNTPAPPSRSPVEGRNASPTPRTSYWFGNTASSYEPRSYRHFQFQNNGSGSHAPTEKTSLLPGEYQRAAFGQIPSYPGDTYS